MAASCNNHPKTKVANGVKAGHTGTTKTFKLGNGYNRPAK